MFVRHCWMENMLRHLHMHWHFNFNCTCVVRNFWVCAICKMRLVTVWLELGLGFRSWSELELGSDLGQKFTNCARTIPKLCGTFYKLYRLTNYMPQLQWMSRKRSILFGEWHYAGYKRALVQRAIHQCQKCFITRHHLAQLPLQFVQTVRMGRKWHKSFTSVMPRNRKQNVSINLPNKWTHRSASKLHRSVQVLHLLRTSAFIDWLAHRHNCMFATNVTFVQPISVFITITIYHQYFLMLLMLLYVCLLHSLCHHRRYKIVKNMIKIEEQNVSTTY